MKRDALPLTPLGITAVCAGLLLAMVPHWTRLPVWIPIVALVCIAWRLAVAWRRWPAPPALVRLALTGIAVVGTVAHYGSVLGRGAGVALLVLMLSLKLLELRRMRDAILTAALTYFVVVTQFLFNQGITVAVTMVASVLVTTTAFMLLQDPDRGRRVADAGRQSATLLLQSLPLMIAMFLLFPRLATPLWGVPQLEDSARTGVSDEMSPGSISQLFIDDTPAFRVSFDGPVPDRSRLYWRGPVLWVYDGETWTRGRPFGFQSRSLERVTESVEYRVSLEPSHRHWLFGLDMPMTRPDGTVITGDFEIVSRRPVDDLRSYDMRSALDYVAGESLGDFARDAALQLPKDYNPETLALGRRWADEAQTPEQVAARALEYFNRESFVYTYNPEPLGRHAMDEFLFDTRMGFCEHYASSFVILMRAAGIPARVVTGYQGGYYNNLGDYLLVRQSDAHAWAEVWFDGRGWVRYDPTSAVDPSRVQLGGAGFGGAGNSGWLANVSLTWDALHNAWNRWVLSYDRAGQRELLGNVAGGSEKWRSAAVMAAGLFAALFIGIFAALRMSARDRTDAATRAWRHYRRKLGRAGLPVNAADGPVTLSERAARRWPGQADAIARIRAALVALRYRQRTTPMTAEALAREIRRLRLPRAG